MWTGKTTKKKIIDDRKFSLFTSTYCFLIYWIQLNKKNCIIIIAPDHKSLNWDLKEISLDKFSNRDHKHEMLTSNKSVVRSTILFLNVSWQQQQCDIISLLINTTQQKSNKRFPWTWRLCRRNIVCVYVNETLNKVL